LYRLSFTYQRLTHDFQKVLSSLDNAICLFDGLSCKS